MAGTYTKATATCQAALCPVIHRFWDPGGGGWRRPGRSIMSERLNRP